MNYALHYSRLMERAETRVLDCYYERHHVVPRCIDKTSLHIVHLTPEEHFVAHQLLVKLYPRHQGLAYALAFMSGATVHTKRNNRLYGWMRRRISEAQKNRIFSPEYRANLSASMKGRVVSPEHRAKLSAAKIGKPGWKHTPESKAKASAGIKAAYASGLMRIDRTTPEYKATMSKAMKGHVVTHETRVKIGVGHTGQKRSDETRRKMSAAQKGKPGKPHTDDERARISATNKATWVLRRAKLAAQREAEGLFA
jgi:hypothetical protein